MAYELKTQTYLLYDHLHCHFHHFVSRYSLRTKGMAHILLGLEAVLTEHRCQTLEVMMILRTQPAIKQAVASQVLNIYFIFTWRTYLHTSLHSTNSQRAELKFIQKR